MTEPCPCCHGVMRPLTQAGSTTSDHCDRCSITTYRPEYRNLALRCPKCDAPVIDTQLETNPDNTPTGRCLYVHKKTLIEGEAVVVQGCQWGMTSFQSAADIGRRL